MRHRGCPGCQAPAAIRHTRSCTRSAPARSPTATDPTPARSTDGAHARATPPKGRTCCPPQPALRDGHDGHQPGGGAGTVPELRCRVAPGGTADFRCGHPACGHPGYRRAPLRVRLPTPRRNRPSAWHPTSSTRPASGSGSRAGLAQLETGALDRAVRSAKAPSRAPAVSTRSGWLVILAILLPVRARSARTRTAVLQSAAIPAWSAAIGPDTWGIGGQSVSSWAVPVSSSSKPGPDSGRRGTDTDGSQGAMDKSAHDQVSEPGPGLSVLPQPETASQNSELANQVSSRASSPTASTPSAVRSRRP
jgi:hypothetical protein